MYFPEEVLLYFKSLNWSLVSKGFGIISKKLAEISAIFNGKGISNLFFPIDLSNFSITVSQVIVTPDMKWAKAFVSPLGGENFDEAMDYLNKNVFSIQKIIASKVRLKRMPKLVFIEDKSFDFASNISQKIKGLN